MKNYRADILNNMMPYFRRDKRLYLLACDMGFGVIDGLRAKFPGRIINCGIMEQAAVGIAAGMSMSGIRPVVYSMVNFLVLRALEQIRNDIVLQNLNVKLIATGANDYFRLLGPSHCCGNDDVRLMKLIKMKVFDPYQDKRKFPEVVKEWMSFEGPAYIRV